MSYCRWSTDDFQCDLYCYADCNGGYTTHVAGNKVVFNEPLPPQVPFDPEHIEEWLARERKVDSMLKRAKRVPLNLPHDGEMFRDMTIRDFLKRLLMLRDCGYKFPDVVIEVLKQEMAEEGDHGHDQRP